MPTANNNSINSKKILLIAGRVRSADKLGHHDYSATCALLSDLLRRIPGCEPIIVENGWPDDDSLFDNASAAVFYDAGAGKQAFFHSNARIAKIQHLLDTGGGLIMLHQCTAFPLEHVELGKSWLGGVYVPGLSRRGHWSSAHRVFPPHPITRGVQAWKIRDGWLNRISFVESYQGITPLVWSGKKHGGSSAGGEQDVTAWAYERPAGGRAFVFTGLDAHSAWSHDGLRHLIANGVLWGAGSQVPADSAWSHMDPKTLSSYLTTRTSRIFKVLGSLGRKTRRVLGSQRKW